MAASWQDVANEWAEPLSAQLRELLSSGLGLLRSRLGVDVGLKPELYPPWAVLMAALAGPLALALLWAAVCGARRRPAPAGLETSADGTEAPAAGAAKSDEQQQQQQQQQKKRSRKKPADKKPQPNGRTVAELQEEVKDAEETPKLTVEVKPEKVKKKKKSKTEVTQMKSISTHDGKEPDEGAWETKISNREKRQQRRKDKAASDDSGSPGGVDHSASILVEPLKVTVTIPAPVAQKKTKGEPLRSKAGKGDPIISQVSVSWNETLAVNGRGWNDGTAKIPVPVPTLDGENWTPLPKGAAHRNPESAAWGQENEGSWSAVDGRGKKPDLNPVSISALSVNPVATDPKPGSDQEWDNQPKVDDEWSGLNGMVEDPSSDWNAPSVRWGNYEETKTPSEELHPEAVKGSDDEKEKEESATAGSGKSKKKKKKRRKRAEEAGTAVLESGEPEKEDLIQQVLEPPPPTRPPVPVPSSEVRAAVGKGRSPKAAPATPCSVQVRGEKPAGAQKDSTPPRPAKQLPRRSAESEPAAMQASPPAPLPKKSEENWESPKQVKKKKARRET